MSRTCVSNTGSPQGCVPPSAALYFAYRQSAGLLRSAVILLSFLMTLHSCLSRRKPSQTAAPLSPAFVERCGKNFLDLNVSKTKVATPFLLPALFTVKTSKLWPLWAPRLTPNLNGLSHTSSGVGKEFLCGRKLVLLARTQFCAASTSPTLTACSLPHSSAGSMVCLWRTGTARTALSKSLFQKKKKKSASPAERFHFSARNTQSRGQKVLLMTTSCQVSSP